MKRLILLVVLLSPALMLADTILDDFQVNTEFPGHPPQKSPYAAARWETETIYVTWLSQRDGVHWDVACNRFNYDLEPLGDAFYLNEPLGVDDCIAPRLALSAAGFGAAWIEDASPHRMIFRSYDDNGNPFSPPVSVADAIADEVKDSLSIAALGDGYLLVWYDERDDSRIWAQKVNFDGDLIGSNFPIRPDSSGSILGLEAQNHPDGRLLVSWVTDQMYSRGRWLDNTGSFIGDVFDMAEPYEYPYVVRSAVRFNRAGLGFMFQYSTESFSALEYFFSFYTLLNELAIQISNRIQGVEWYDDNDIGMYITTEKYSFPDLFYVADTSYVSIRWKDYHYRGSWGQTVQKYYNLLYSTDFGSEVIPWGVVQEGEYALAQINDAEFIYCFGLGAVGMRIYQTNDLNTFGPVRWMAEPGFQAAQSLSAICVHDNGSFRVIYDNHLGSIPQIYTRHFNQAGQPSAEDTVVCYDCNLNPAHVPRARMKKTFDEQTMIIWAFEQDVHSTTFEADSWSGIVLNYNVDPLALAGCVPNFDINDNNELLLTWIYCTEGYSEFDRALYFQSFTDFNNPLYLSQQFVFYGYSAVTFEFDAALRDDGRYLLCRGPTIVVYRGLDYYTTLDFLVVDGGDYPNLEKSDIGYVLTWNNQEQARYMLFDSDGLQISDVIVASGADAVVIGEPGLGVAASGNFAVCWQDARFDEGDIYCRQFNPDGSFYGREYRVNSDPVGPKQCEPAVAFGPNDQLYFTWTDFRNEGGQGDIYCKVIEWEDATAVEPENEPAPYSFALHQPYPNPFNPATIISFEISVAGLVKLDIFDVNGRNVGALREAPFEPGLHHVPFDGANLASGVYFIRLQAGEFQQTQKLVLLN